jgi:hypothetical protein
MGYANKAHYKQEETEKKPSVKIAPEKINFVVEEDDILIQNGLYRGYSVRELWESDDPRVRDYIMTKIWFQRDLEANAIINRLCFS